MKQGVQVVFLENNKILLLKRKNTGYFDDYYGLPGGKVELHENTIECAIRETREEVGLMIQESEHLFSLEKDAWTHSYFIAKKWLGEATNCELTKCSEIRWCEIDSLSENITPHVQIVVSYLLQDNINIFLE